MRGIPWPDPIRRYLRSAPTRGLHLGCGRNLLPGWLNCDHRCLVQGVIRLDVRDRFPIDGDQFDYVFSEHLIEHLTFEHGSRMLAECYRVLRAGGRIRISTPDLAFVVGLYAERRSELQERYLRWAVSDSSKSHVRPPADDRAMAPADVFVINNFMRDWGHEFVYDERALRYALHRARFRHVVRCRLHESAHEALRNLENHSRLPDGFLELETFTLEAEK